MTIRRRLAAQFGHPTGPIGALAGLIMANRGSNRERNARTLDLLNIQPGERVLEVGYGPGWAVAHAARLAPQARLVGVDHSEVMWRQASRRNAAAIRRGQVTLVAGTVADLSDVEPFAKAYAVNVLMFWPDPVAVLREISGLLAPGGVVALSQQPRNKGATEGDVRAAGDRLVTLLCEAGFGAVRLHRIALRPVDAVCAVAEVGLR